MLFFSPILLAKVIPQDDDDIMSRDMVISRLSAVINKEYSIQAISNIEIGLVNFPQWFASVHLLKLDSLTFNNDIEGQEALYPTNITHQRWMYTFKNSSFEDVTKCRRILMKWTTNHDLKITMSSQIMTICLASIDNFQLDTEDWYQSCWRKFNGRICR